MARYASQTTVSSDRSRAEIESTLRRYGADGFAYMSEADRAIIGFRFNGRTVKFLLPLPDRKDFERTPDKHLWRSPEATDKAWEQGTRQRWRALSLCIKAKLEAVEAGIVSFDDEFLAHFVLPGGQTVGQRWGEEYRKMLDGGQSVPLLTE